MIQQHRIALEVGDAQVGATLAYPLYAWLLSCVPHEAGALLHEDGAKPLTQYVCREQETFWWVINLLTDDAITLFAPVLEQKQAADLHLGTISFEQHTVETIESPQEIITRAQSLQEINRFPLTLLTPTAFKQQGRYVILPQESLILQSLVRRWDESFPDYPLDDPDAFQALLQGTHIVDYSLHSLRHPLKQTKIPSFQGRVILEAHLSAPLMEIMKTLYVFAPYAGLGIKNALGMGGVKTMAFVKT